MDPTLEDVHASRNYTTPMNKFPENRVFCFYVRFFCTVEDGETVEGNTTTYDESSIKFPWLESSQEL